MLPQNEKFKSVELRKMTDNEELRIRRAFMILSSFLIGEDPSLSHQDISVNLGIVGEVVEDYIDLHTE